LRAIHQTKPTDRAPSPSKKAVSLLYLCNALFCFAAIIFGKRQQMFDVYLNDKRDLLIVRKGLPIPLSCTRGRWRKKKRMVVRVSEEINQTVQRQGYYVRKLSDWKN
jgi:hypothetical protein